MKYRLALVEYLNTFPFSEGLKLNRLEEKLDILPVTPAQCAILFGQGNVDISLCPVGALEQMPAHEIFGNYCLGADGEVGSVMLLSKVPLDEVVSVRLDDHSRTSNLLIQILADRLWKKDWAFYFGQEKDLSESCLMIGDKVFEYKSQYPYQYDLAEAWKRLSGLPMVFAVWIARPGVPLELKDQLDDAFKAGIDYIQTENNGLSDWQRHYLLHNISYSLDATKREALKLFLLWAESFGTVPVSR